MQKIIAGLTTFLLAISIYANEVDTQQPIENSRVPQETGRYSSNQNINAYKKVEYNSDYKQTRQQSAQLSAEKRYMPYNERTSQQQIDNEIPETPQQNPILKSEDSINSQRNIPQAVPTAPTGRTNYAPEAGSEQLNQNREAMNSSIQSDQNRLTPQEQQRYNQIQKKQEIQSNERQENILQQLDRQ